MGGGSLGAVLGSPFLSALSERMSGMPDANFYAHQHSQSSGDAETVVPLSSMFTVANGAGGVEHAREGVQISVGNLMSPYKPPLRRLQDNPEKVLCGQDGCKAFPMKTGDHGLCTGHARSMGLIENWKRAGRDGVTG